MHSLYWFTRDDCNLRIQFNCSLRFMQNLDPFLSMARLSCLREALEALRGAPEASYSTCPGEYLRLRAEQGMVEAEINIFGDEEVVRIPVALFCQITAEYLEEMDTMLRNRGLR